MIYKPGWVGLDVNPNPTPMRALFTQPPELFFLPPEHTGGNKTSKNVKKDISPLHLMKNILPPEKVPPEQLLPPENTLSGGSVS